MKFLCDRCKTRYSIGDDRVRGKILKIRCKSCGNVITVREGMIADAEPPPPAVPAHVGRAKKPTTMAPAALNEASEPVKAVTDAGSEPQDAPDEGPTPRPERAGGSRPGPRRPDAPAASAREPAGAVKDRAGPLGAARRSAPADGAGHGQPGAGKRGGGLPGQRGEPVNALGAAFASAMAKPPPALEEEWYVSIDGDQAGPFSLTEAQHWVAQKASGDELHCWSEGFDDWLPVDKVSHFRGLRHRPAAPAAPPPLPRVGGVRQRSAPVAPVAVPEAGDATPLFAATMASLERGGPAASSPGLPSPATPAAPSARATPPLGIPSRAHPAGKPSNGSRVPARDPGHDDAGAGNLKPDPVSPVLVRPADGRRAGAPSPGPVRPGAVGDPFDTGEAGDAKTQIEAMPFSDPLVEPLRATPASSTLQGTGANAAVTSPAAVAGDFGSDDEELAIGEVSRVVKLADIVRTPRPAGPRRAASATGAIGRRTGQNPSLRSTASVAALLPGATMDGAPPAPADVDPAMTLAPIRKSHRRGLIALLGVAGVMVIGGIIAVILLVTTNDEPTGSSLGQVRGIDTSRPEDPITHRPIDPAGPANPAPNPFAPHAAPHPARPNLIPAPTGSDHDPEPPPGNSLRGDEIEDIAHKHQDMTQRCYLRSQRGADAILIGDVKKITVTLMIDRDGNVTGLQLSEHAADNLGKCLTGSIRGWKFRPSSGGTFRFSLNFVSG